MILDTSAVMAHCGPMVLRQLPKDVAKSSTSRRSRPPTWAFS